MPTKLTSQLSPPDEVKAGLDMWFLENHLDA
jgi:hypothetical protein